jgi:hypothetical protein
MEFFKQHGHCVGQHSIHKTSNLLTGPSTYAVKVFTTGASKFKLEKAIELWELGFYKTKN